MNFYFKNRKIGAIFVEINRELGIIPLYSFSKWKNEHIINLPWINIILTPRQIIITEEEKIKNGDALNHHKIPDVCGGGSPPYSLTPHSEN